MRAPASAAALMNGFLAHALDFDDTHHESRIHPSCVIVPTVLAVAEEQRRSGAELVTAAVVGYEVALRVGLAAPGLFHERGWHATSVCGALGAAAAAGRLLGLGGQQLVNALGVVTSMASGLREAYLGQGTDTKALHAGWAAQSGITAAELAGRGFTGAVTALEGRFGYFNAFLSPSPWELESRVESLGRMWYTPEVTFKLFPCGSLTHGCVDAALELSDATRLDLRSVERIVCVVPAGMVSTVCEPREVKLAPRSGYEAKFSVQYAVAAALARGRLTEQEFQPEALEDPDLRYLLARTDYEVDPDLPFPSRYPGGVRVTFADGTTLASTRPNSPGTKEWPVADDQIVRKFMHIAGEILDPATASEIADRVLEIDQEEELGDLMAAVGGGAQQWGGA